MDWWLEGGKDVRNSSLCTLLFTVMFIILYIMTRKALLLKSVYIYVSMHRNGSVL